MLLGVSGLLTVPNVSEGRDVGADRAPGRRLRRGRGPARRPLRPGPQPNGLHPCSHRGRRRAGTGRRSPHRDRGAEPVRAPRRASPDRRARRRARRVARRPKAAKRRAIRPCGRPRRSARWGFRFFSTAISRPIPSGRSARSSAAAASTRSAPGWSRASCAPIAVPAQPHPTAGATLVTARPPLAAFNLELEGASLAAAREIAAELRESGGGIPGVRAIGLEFGERTQVSTNVHDPVSVPLAEVVARTAALAARHGARVVEAEIVGLVPQGGARRLPGGPAARRLRSEARRDRGADTSARG